MSEDKKAMIVGIPVIFIGLLCLVYFNIKDNQDFIVIVGMKKIEQN